MLNLRARQYEPTLMRFSQRDILRGDLSMPLSLNRYLYCANDPVNFTDFDGLKKASLWSKIKSVASSAAKAVTRVVTNTVKAVASVAVTAVKNAVTKVKAVYNTAKAAVNTVRSVIDTAKTSGVNAAVNQAAASAAAAPAYLANTYAAANAEIRANIAQSAATVIDLKKDSAAALSTFLVETYGELSPRNQEIINKAGEKVRELQASGASQAEIAAVMLHACREIGKNVGETVSTDVFETATGKDAFISPDDAAKAFGKEANTLTKNTGNEHMAAMYSVDVLGNRVYFNGNTLEGTPLGVGTEFVGTLIGGKALEKVSLGLIQYEGFTHTHPDDTNNGNWNWQFSDFQSNGIINGGGDQGAAIVGGRCYMVDQTGDTYLLDREAARSALFDGNSVNKYPGYLDPTRVNPTNKPTNLAGLEYSQYVGNSGGEVY